MRWKARTSSETWRTTITNVRILNMNIWATCISIREQDRAATRNWLLLADFYQRQQSPSSSWSSHLSLLSPLLFLFHHPPLFIYYPSSSLFTVLIFSSRTYLPSFFYTRLRLPSNFKKHDSDSSHLHHAMQLTISCTKPLFNTAGGTQSLIHSCIP